VAAALSPRPHRRSYRTRRPRAATVPGSWYRREAPPPWANALEEAEAGKERVRMLLERYGILFRELLEREEPPFRWGAVFRSLRLMELAGEVTTGRFFTGIPGLQFASRAAVQSLDRLSEDSEDAVYWLNAADPASVAGLGLEGLPTDMPARRASTHLVFHGPRLTLVSQRHGRVLDFRIPPDHPDVDRYLGVLEHLLNRATDPVRLLVIERINDLAAPRSPYAELLRQRFVARMEGTQIVLLRQP
jgi:ATP-dependent helicase Lhr and Lhr-like helicase